ncbi:sn-glycerol-3-phosphate transport system permease protein UgpA [Peptococcaceae bacterium CEB3]|nr:sn-glycerol-3-phosphate transport system permease protein UgpA [Peptococcaceae bacterium CEB3]
MRKKRWTIIVSFLAPGFVLYVLFIIYPFLSSIRYSFYNWNGVGPLIDFVGLKNFAYALFSHNFAPFFWRAILHNLYFFAVTMILTSVFGVLLAYLLVAVHERTSRWFQVIYFIPMVVPPVVVAYVWSMYLEPNYGVLPQLLEALHLNALNVPFLGSAGLAIPTIAVITAWAGMGLPILIFVAAMINIPEEMIEAARVDGATRFRTFVSVIFPFIKPTFLTITTLIFVGAFGAFDYIFIMEGTQAGPNYATDVIGTLFYRTAFGGFGTTAQSMGLATALAFLGFLIVMIASTILVLLQRSASRNL